MDNKKRNWIIVGVIVILVAVALLVYPSIKKTDGSCSQDSDCVPASCCHASSCALAQQAPACQGISCTMECSPGTLDCGQGLCRCINNKCGADFTQTNGKKSI